MRRTIGILLAVLAWLAPSPVASIEVVRGLPDTSLTSPADIATVLLAVVAAGGWALLCWLLAVAALQLLGTLPGVLGRVSAILAGVLAPLAVRRGLAVLLGLGLTTAPAAAWATSAPRPTTATASAPATASADLPDLDWPSARTLTDPAVPAPTVPTRNDHVVAPGESLWSIAATRLGPKASAKQVAAAWPRWWQANRDAIGTDPDLIRPGTHLLPPTPSTERERP